MAHALLNGRLLTRLLDEHVRTRTISFQDSTDHPRASVADCYSLPGKLCRKGRGDGLQHVQDVESWDISSDSSPAAVLATRFRFRAPTILTAPRSTFPTGRPFRLSPAPCPSMAIPITSVEHLSLYIKGLTPSLDYSSISKSRMGASHPWSQVIFTGPGTITF